VSVCVGNCCVSVCGDCCVSVCGDCVSLCGDCVSVCGDCCVSVCGELGIIYSHEVNSMTLSLKLGCFDI
jgi:hypothetical protein